MSSWTTDTPSSADLTSKWAIRPTPIVPSTCLTFLRNLYRIITVITNLEDISHKWFMSMPVGCCPWMFFQLFVSFFFDFSCLIHSSCCFTFSSSSHYIQEVLLFCSQFFASGNFCFNFFLSGSICCFLLLTALDCSCSESFFAWPYISVTFVIDP